MAVTVVNPNTANVADGYQPAHPIGGRQGEQLIAQMHGKYFAANLRKNVFKFNVTAVAVTVVANNLVSVFGLYNPPGSGVIAEMISTEVGQDAAATIVDTLGWYFSNATLSAAATFTTLAAANTNYFSGRVGDVPSGAVRPYTAVTHSGTPVRCDIVCSWGATTDAGLFSVPKQHDGALLLPPGILMSLAVSTTITTAVGLDLACSWAEWPYVG